MLHARITHPYTGRGLEWLDFYGIDGMRAVEIKSNTDLEEQFHWMFGPHVIDGYVEELEDMLSSIVHGSGESFICSTVRIECTKLAGRLFSIHQIFIRPCLQKNKVLGKILLFLAQRLAGYVISIENCMPDTVNALNKYYGGADASIFETDVAHTSGYMTYRIKDIGKFIEKIKYVADIPYPSYETLNSKRHLSRRDIEWAKYARVQHKYMIQPNILEYQFRKGYKDVSLEEFRAVCKEVYEQANDLITQKEICVIYDRDPDITPEEMNEAYSVVSEFSVLCDMTEKLLYSNEFPHADLFIPDAKLVRYYWRAIEQLRRNVFVICILKYLHMINPSQKDDFRHLNEMFNSMKTLLETGRMVVTTNPEIESDNFLDFRDLKKTQMRKIADLVRKEYLAWGCITEHMYISSRLSLKSSSSTDFWEITFKFHESLHVARQEYLHGIQAVLDALKVW